MRLLSGALVVATALYLIGLAATVYARPAHAERFLLAFARSARAHYLEQAVRLVVGASLVAHAPEMVPSGPFRVFGWVLLLTSAGLLCVPWRWHRRFAEWVVPPVVRHMRLYGFGAGLLGVLLLLGMLAGESRSRPHGIRHPSKPSPPAAGATRSPAPQANPESRPVPE